MASIHECRDDNDWKALLTMSREKPVFLFKHSTTCPSSAGAWLRFSRFAEEETEAGFWRLLVKENRELAVCVAESTGIKHESPQVILFRGGLPLASKTHRAITETTLRELLSSNKIK